MHDQEELLAPPHYPSDSKSSEVVRKIEYEVAFYHPYFGCLESEKCRISGFQERAKKWVLERVQHTHTRRLTHAYVLLFYAAPPPLTRPTDLFLDHHFHRLRSVWRCVSSRVCCRFGQKNFFLSHQIRQRSNVVARNIVARKHFAEVVYECCKQHWVLT